MENKEAIKFIIDLVKLKNANLKSQSLSVQEGIIAQNNTFYSLLDSLIAHFMDKYKIKDRELMEEFYKSNLQD